MPAVLLPASDNGEYYYWIDQDDGVHALTLDAGYGVLADLRARWMAALQHAEITVPGRPGTRVTQTRRQPVTIDLALHVAGETYAEVRSKVGLLARWLNTTQSAGALRVDGPEGTSRQIGAYATYEVDEGQDSNWSTAQNVAVSLYCPDAYWYDVASTTATYTTGVALPFLPATFPLVLSSTTVLAAPVVVNDGDEDAWPVWVVTGPCTGLAFYNLSTGKGLVSEAGFSLGAGEQAVIDTRPGAKSITDGRGSNLYQSFSRTLVLWPLVRGSNSLSIELAGATAASAVALSYQRCWLGP